MLVSGEVVNTRSKQVCGTDAAFRGACTARKGHSVLVCEVYLLVDI